jgi:mannan polymerase II complex MNN10 subunit
MPFDLPVLTRHTAYASKHSYHLEFDWSGDGYWHKVKMIERLIIQDEYDWIWWIDYDSLITNTDIKLEDLINDSLASVSDPDRIDLLLTPDWFVYLLTSAAVAPRILTSNSL